MTETCTWCGGDGLALDPAYPCLECGGSGELPIEKEKAR